MMTLAGTQDRKKLVRECGYPLTARVAVDRIYTDLGVLVPANPGFTVFCLSAGTHLDDLQQFSEVLIIWPRS
jgi:3-oxoadipate CoA-transferase beta subunit